MTDLISIGQFAALTSLSPKIAEHLAAPSVERIDRWQADLEVEIADRRLALDHLAQLTQPLHEPTTPPKEHTVPTTTPTDTSLTRAIPVLASVDLVATASFYAERLGFEVVATYPDYLITERDDIEIHFWLTDDVEIPKQTGCYVRVQGVDALYAEMQAAGVVHPNGPLTDQFYGVRDFAVLDGDGNLIKFGERRDTDE